VLTFEIAGAIALVSDQPSPTSADLLSRAVTRLTSERSNDFAIHHLCPQCGGADHGQPFVRGSSGAKSACVISFSRTSGFETAVAQSGGSVGIDIERVSRIALHSVDDVLLHPEERSALDRLGNAAAARYRALLWVAKEAVLKSTGSGLRVDLRDIQLSIDGQTGTPESWPPDLPLAEVHVTFFDVSADVVGALASD
jgi:4'-phosphopantetheinyl transferase